VWDDAGPQGVLHVDQVSGPQGQVADLFDALGSGRRQRLMARALAPGAPGSPGTGNCELPRDLSKAWTMGTMTAFGLSTSSATDAYF